MNFLIDNNVILDYYNDERSALFTDSVEAINYILNHLDHNAFISSSALDNLEFVKATELKRELGTANKIIIKNFIQDIVSKFKLAKTPSYMEIDYEDIEDSQIIASAKAINAKVITRDQKMLKKYPNTTISPSSFSLLPSPSK